MSLKIDYFDQNKHTTQYKSLVWHLSSLLLTFVYCAVLILAWLILAPLSLRADPLNADSMKYRGGLFGNSVINQTTDFLYTPGSGNPSQAVAKKTILPSGFGPEDDSGHPKDKPGRYPALPFEGWLYMLPDFTRQDFLDSLISPLEKIYSLPVGKMTTSPSKGGGQLTAISDSEGESGISESRATGHRRTGHDQDQNQDQPPKYEDQHVHRDQGKNCPALACGNSPCRCQKCLDQDPVPTTDKQDVNKRGVQWPAQKISGVRQLSSFHQLSLRAAVPVQLDPVEMSQLRISLAGNSGLKPNVIVSGYDSKVSDGYIRSFLNPPYIRITTSDHWMHMGMLSIHYMGGSPDHSCLLPEGRLAQWFSYNLDVIHKRDSGGGIVKSRVFDDEEYPPGEMIALDSGELVTLSLGVLKIWHEVSVNQWTPRIVEGNGWHHLLRLSGNSFLIMRHQWSNVEIWYWSFDLNLRRWRHNLYLQFDDDRFEAEAFHLDADKKIFVIGHQRHSSDGKFYRSVWSERHQTWTPLGRVHKKNKYKVVSDTRVISWSESLTQKGLYIITVIDAEEDGSWCATELTRVYMPNSWFEQEHFLSLRDKRIVVIEPITGSNDGHSSGASDSDIDSEDETENHANNWRLVLWSKQHDKWVSVTLAIVSKEIHYLIELSVGLLVAKNNKSTLVWDLYNPESSNSK